MEHEEQQHGKVVAFGRNAEPRTMRVAVFNDTRKEDRHFGCDIVMRNLEKLLLVADMEPVWSWPVDQDWRQFPERMPQPGSVDAVIVNGEGTIHHSAERPQAEMLVDVAAFANDTLGVPAFLVNATVFQNAIPSYKKLLGFKRCFVRDSLSHDDLYQNGLNSIVVPDLTLAVQRKDLVDSPRNGIGATDSVFGKMSRRIRKLAERSGWEYQPMVALPPLEYGWRDVLHPLEFLRKLERHLRRRRYAAPQLPSSDAFLEWLSSKQLIVTGRYHTVTLCILTRTPFVAIASNTPKISSLLQDIFGTDRRVMRSLEDCTEEVLARHAHYDEQELAAIDAFLDKTTQTGAHMMEVIRADTLAHRQRQNRAGPSGMRHL